MNPVVMTIINSEREIGRAGDVTSNLFSSPVRYWLSYGTQPWWQRQSFDCSLSFLKKKKKQSS